MILDKLNIITYLMMGASAVLGTLTAAGMAPDAFMFLAYLFLFVASALVLGFAIKFMISHPKQAKTLLIGTGVMVALMLITFFISDNTPVYDLKGKTVIADEFTSQFSGMAVKLIMILMIIAIGSLVYSSLVGFIKKK